ERPSVSWRCTGLGLRGLNTLAVGRVKQFGPDEAVLDEPDDRDGLGALDPRNLPHFAGQKLPEVMVGGEKCLDEEIELTRRHRDPAHLIEHAEGLASLLSFRDVALNTDDDVNR